jgi:hypothetical protein
MQVWAFLGGMSFTFLPPSWYGNTIYSPEFDPSPKPASPEPAAAEPGVGVSGSPPPGHPELLAPHVAPTPVERALWAHLGEKLDP